MNNVNNWIEHLQHPLVLAGFGLFIFALLLRPLFLNNKKISGAGMERLLRRGINFVFILALLAIIGGIALNWQKNDDKRYKVAANKVQQVVQQSSGEKTADATVEQATQGTQSPAINNGKDVRINYGPPSYSTPDFSQPPTLGTLVDEGRFTKYDAKPMHILELLELNDFLLRKSNNDHQNKEPSISTDNLLNKMNFGTIVFNYPETINLEGTFTVQLLLSLTETIAKLKKQVLQEGEQIGATVKVSDIMVANLVGPMFEITPITPQEQAISKKQNTEWKWELHPKKEGKHNLHLTLTAIFEVNGQKSRRSIKSFEQKIEVNITTSQQLLTFTKENWEWLWATILVPIAGWFLNRKKKVNQNNVASSE